MWVFDRLSGEKSGFDAIIAAIGDGLHEVDTEYRIVSQNQLLDNFFGEHVGEHCYKAFCGLESLCGECPAVLAFADGKIHSVEKALQRDEQEIFVEITASPIKDNSGRVLSVIEVIKDVTSRKQSEEAIKNQQKRLEEQLFYQRALHRIAETIAANDNIQLILENMTSIIGETMQIDRCLLYEISLIKQQAIGLYGWRNPDAPGAAAVLSIIDLAKFPGRDSFIKERTWWESHQDAMNPILINDHSAELFHGKLGIKSLLWYPFAFCENGCYLLAINQVRYRREWRRAEIEFLGTVTKLVALAVQKIRLLEEQQMAEQAIWEEKERAQVTLKSIGDAVITTDAEGKVEFLNTVAEGMTGWTNDKARGLSLTTVFNIVDEETGAAVENPVTRCLREERVVGLADNKVLLCCDGRRFAIEDSAASIRNREGQVIGVVLVFHDVTEKRTMMHQLMHQAYHDHLTDLPNRLLFNDRISSAMSYAHRHKTLLAVMFFDLDRFKMVNDMYGHTMGDELLKGVARRLGGCVRKSDTFSRFGGDEFAFLMTGVKMVEDAARMSQKLLDNLGQPLIIKDQEFILTASIGIAIYPNDADNAATLMKLADIAMYRAKETGGNHYQLSAPEINQKMQEKLSVENSLRAAVKRDELTVYYQPQVNINTGEIVGSEALVRWQHPERGLVAPGEFIPVAEESGLIITIGDWVLRRACNQNKAWQEAGYKPMKVTVNISARQFQRKAFMEGVARVLNETGLDPQWLELEITESIAMQDVEYTVFVLDQLSNMGIHIAIDDFGTGYSSLSYLKRFPIHTLKIDRSFVSDVAVDPDDAAIVSTIIVLARTLNLKVIAEGVETKEQLEFLKQRQCCDVQGFYFSRPVPAKDFEVLLRGNGFAPERT